jgi:hypothetical protein
MDDNHSSKSITSDGDFLFEPKSQPCIFVTHAASLTILPFWGRSTIIGLRNLEPNEHISYKITPTTKILHIVVLTI